MVNESVTEVVPSLAVMTTLWSPTSALSGVPASTPVDAVKVAQLGTVVPVKATVSPLSTSAAVTVYEYAASSSTEVTAVLVIVGASLVLATAMVNESVTEAVPSLAVMTTLWSPTSSLSGVPASTPVDAVKVAQLGTVVPVKVIVSPLSTSLAVTVYEYDASSLTAVTAVLEIVGASLVLATAMVNESVTEPPLPSLAVITTMLSPTSALSGVPASTPVDAVKVAQLGTVVPVKVIVSPLSTSAAVTV
jgi:hypothetical protein